jgi:peptide/nickel transport system substrate-binding protein
VAVALGTALAACGNSGGGGGGGGGGNGNGSPSAGGYGTLPAQVGSASSGKSGVVNFAEQPGAGPNYIFPITPSANSSVFVAYQFQYLMWRPLYWSPVGYTPTINYPLSLASKPTFSNGNRTVSFTMNSNYKWSNGQPVDGQDVVFAVDLVKAAVKESAANWGNYTPGYFPDNVTSLSANGNTVTMHLNKAYNPGWFLDNQLGLITPLPHTAWAIDKAGGPKLDYTVPANAKKIYDFLNKASTSLSTWASNPIWQTVDGPFHLTSFTASNSAATLKPNPSYGGPYKATHITAVNEVPFTSTTAEFNQLRAGTLTVGTVDPTDLPQVATLKANGYNVWGYPDFGFQYIAFNFKDATGHWNKIINQLYVRQALAHLINDAGDIHAAYFGAGADAYGPVPSIPKSPYAPSNASTTPYPYSTSAAKSLLTGHGWSLSGGTLTCQKPGTSASECGAGIPKGTPLATNLYYYPGGPGITTMDTEFVSAASKIGIKIKLISATFDTILTHYNDVSAPSNDNKWGMEDFGGFTDSIYPTTNTIFNTTGSYNEGGYSNPTANTDINNSVYGGNPSAVKSEASFITSNLPGLFLPNPDDVYAWKNTVSGPTASFETLTQYNFNPEEWYFTK